MFINLRSILNLSIVGGAPQYYGKPLRLFVLNLYFLFHGKDALAAHTELYGFWPAFPDFELPYSHTNILPLFMRGSIMEDALLKDRPEIKKHAVENILCRRSFSYGDGFFSSPTIYMGLPRDSSPRPFYPKWSWR